MGRWPSQRRTGDQKWSTSVVVNGFWAVGLSVEPGRSRVGQHRRWKRMGPPSTVPGLISILVTSSRCGGWTTPGCSGRRRSRSRSTDCMASVSVWSPKPSPASCATVMGGRSPTPGRPATPSPPDREGHGAAGTAPSNPTQAPRPTPDGRSASITTGYPSRSRPPGSTPPDELDNIKRFAERRIVGDD